MPRYPLLSFEEQRLILCYDYLGESSRDIARMVRRSRHAVENFLSDPKNYGKRKSSGRPRLLDKRDVQRVRYELSKDKATCTSVRRDLRLSVSRQTVWRTIVRSGKLKWRRMLKTLDLKQRHKDTRVAWCFNKGGLNEGWKSFIFTDEKKINMDGPDGFKSFWKDETGKNLTYLSRHTGGGGLMLWGAVSHEGKSELAVLKGNINADKYMTILEEYLLPFVYENHGLEGTFVQDNAPIHTAGKVNEWLKQTEFEVEKWPAKSPDLNPIENIWGALARALYHGGKQYHTLTELEKAAKEAWASISVEFVRKHVASMPKRCLKAVQSKGNKIAY